MVTPLGSAPISYLLKEDTTYSWQSILWNRRQSWVVDHCQPGAVEQGGGQDVKVNIRGKRGRGSKTQITTLLYVNQEENMKLANPISGTDLDIATEIVAAIRDRWGKCRVQDCDDTAVNTVFHTEAHQFVCLSLEP